MFKKFFILQQHSDKYRFIFPNEITLKNVIEEPFLFPCSDIKSYEHGPFVVVLTVINGDHNFLISNYIDNGNACVCFQSDHGWFELLYAAMSVVIQSRMYLANNEATLEGYLKSLVLLPSPIPGLVMYIPGAHPHDLATKVVVPIKTRQKPFSSFIAELYSRIQFEDWLIIFESLLLENWIVFHSRYLGRVTSCIFASLSLLFPFEWVHLIFPCLSEASVNCLGCPSPYIAGVHSCLIEKVIPLLSSGAVIVDIDEGIIRFITSDDSAEDEHLPKSLVNFLWRNWSNCDMRLLTLKRRINLDQNEKDNIMTQMLSGFLEVIAFLLGRYHKCKAWDATLERFCVDNDTLSFLRGELFQPFIRRLLQSQMVHQFFDDKVNKGPSEKRGSLKICLDDIDDFEEACQTMEKWQPDIYTDAIVSIATKSKRRINVFANKVLDLAKKTEFINKSNDVNTRWYEGIYDKDYKLTTVDTSTINIMSYENIPREEIKVHENWIKFEETPDPRMTRTNLWENNVKEPMEDLLTFEEMIAPVVSSTANSQSKTRGIILDFDPLFKN